MAQKDRDKEYWLIPKRANLHQSVVLIDGIVSLNYNGKTWNPSKQDRLGAYLGRSGATNNGKNITPQALRTLLASIPQYFGFTFINTETTPNTLVLTKVGEKILEEQKEFLDNYDFNNLREAEKHNGCIQYSEIYLKQFLKLQITNPVLLKDCENVFLFPLVFTLKVLKKTKYLTYEEIAYFIFRSKHQSEIELVILEIENFRNLSYDSQNKLIETFKGTHLGNISLVQAPTSSYFQKLCFYTGLILKSEIEIFNPKNREKKKLNTITLNQSKEKVINDLIEEYTYSPYDFGNDLHLWLQYIGNDAVKSTPVDVQILNDTTTEQLIVISQNDTIIKGDLVLSKQSVFFPSIETTKYEISIFNKRNGDVIEKMNYIFGSGNLVIDKISDENINPKDQLHIKNEILEHINSKDFSRSYSPYLNIVSKFTKKDLINSKSLRGSRLEYLFYQYFKIWEERNIIDEVIWNGKVGNYGIPSQAPGGPTGDPDLIIFVDNNLIVIELTTIRPKAQQWTAEGASVPDHIRLIEDKYPDYNIFAFYLAPIIHDERVTKAMLSRLKEYQSKLHCIEIENFMTSCSLINSKDEFIKYFND
jgi:hypothetical protein